jgi:hypothetical protein
MEKKEFKDLVILALDGRTQKWLSEKSGIHKTEISLLLTGRLKPTEKQKEKIRNAFPYKVNF